MMDEEGDSYKLNINEDYAQKFNYHKKRQELEKLKNKYGDNPNELLDNDSSSSSIDEITNGDLDLNDPDFINVLTLIKSGNKQIYDKNTDFFETTNDTTIHCDNSGSESPKNCSKKRNKPIYLKDYQFQQAIELERKATTTNESEQATDEEEHYIGTGESHIEKEIKKNIIQNTTINDNDDDDDNNNNDSSDKDDFFFPSKNPKYISHVTDEHDINRLKKIIQNEYMDEKIINMMKGNEITLKTINKQSMKSGTNNVHIDEESDDENIELTSINHDGIFARKKDDRRIKKRNEKKARKKEEKLNMLNEIKLLKLLQQDNLTDKIQQLNDIAGIDTNKNSVKSIDFSELIDKDFDAKEYDNIMNNLFNDEYYADINDTNKDQLKPLNCVDDIDGDMDILKNFIGDDPNNQPLQRLTKQMKKRLRKEEKKIKTKQKLQKSLLNQSKTNEINSDDNNTSTQMFAYRQTFANNFGLTPEEILLCNDKELNQWCSLKKCIRYKDDDEELADYAIYAKKSKKLTKKSKILKSIYNPTQQQSTNQ